MRGYLSLALVAALGLGTVSTTHAQTITETLAADTSGFDSNKFDFDILLTAVVTAGLDDDLNDAGLDVTVFAPNDLAFIRLARDLGYTGMNEEDAWNYLVDQLTTLGSGDPLAVLIPVLTYHVGLVNYTPFEIFFGTFTGLEIDTLQGGTIDPFFFRLRDNDPDFADPRFLPFGSIPTDNGRIIRINRVLIPLDI